MVVTIKRSRWSTKPEDNRLLDPVSKRMCCLGFCALAAGYKRSDIIERAEPDELLDESKWNEKFGALPILSMMRINDSKDMSRKEKEPKLIELAARGGVTLQFVD